MAKHSQRPSRNLLLLGAVLLTVGLIVEYLESVVMGLKMHIVLKTLVIMFMIAVGFGFAAAVIAPWARDMLVILMRPFKRAVGVTAGRVIFYAIIYAVLFVAYLLYFIL